MDLERRLIYPELSSQTASWYGRTPFFNVLTVLSSYNELCATIQFVLILVLMSVER
jgi:hypothetical protein